MQESPLFEGIYGAQHRFTRATGFFVLFSLSVLAFLGLLVSVLTRQFGWFVGITLLILVWETIFSAGPLLVAGWNLIRPAPKVLSGAVPTMTIIIPVWNEVEALPRTLDSLLVQADQPEKIIVSDDGSTDGSLTKLMVDYGVEFMAGNLLGRSRRYPHLYALRKPHGGKADSLNQAIALSTDDVVMVLDADTRLYPGAIAAVRQSFAQHPTIHAVAGVPIPSCSNTWHGRLFQFFQRYEYMRGFVWHVGWNTFDAVTIISGACSAFRRELLGAIGGYDANNWTEDCEIIFRMQAYLRSRGEEFRVKIDPKFLAQTDAPDTISSFLRQRRRWLGGFLETLFQYRHLVGDRRYGAWGMGYLTHATLSIVSPFNLILGTIGGILFTIQGYLLPDLIWMIVLGSWIYSTVISFGRLALYQSQIGRNHLSWANMLLDNLVAPWVYHPMMAIAHLWGYYSCFKRQRSW